MKFEDDHTHRNQREIQIESSEYSNSQYSALAPVLKTANFRNTHDKLLE